MKPFKNILLFIWIIVFFEHNVNAQNLSFKHYGLKEGLSQETIRCIVKDSNGFLWLGTQDGLNRFDSSVFKTYKNKKNDSLSISGNFINTLLEDNNGNIWIGTNDNGICVYNSRTDSFKKTTVKTGNCTSLSKTKDGTIYGTILNKGIVVFKKQNKDYNANIITDFNTKKLHFTTTFVYKTKLYVGTSEGLVFVAKKQNKQPLKFKEIPLKKSIGSIHKIIFNEGIMWLGTSQGLFTLNVPKKKLTPIYLEKNKFLKKSIESIKINKNFFYIGTDNGLFIASKFDLLTSEFKRVFSYKENKNNTNTITSRHIYDILINNKLLFIGTNKLDLASLEKPVFKHINTKTKPAINNRFVLSILKQKEYTFVGTQKGLNCIDSNNKVTYITKKNTQQKLAYDVIRGMAVDAKNNLWLATIKGVSVINLTNFNPNKPQIKSIYHNIKDTLSLSSNITRNIYIDHNKTVWITTYGGGVNRFIGNLETNTYSFIRYQTNTNKNAISSNYTYNITQDKDLAYWITSEKGLNKLTFSKKNYNEPRFTNFYHQKKNTNSLNSNTTLHTYHDKNNTLWIATQDGFHQYNKESKTFIRYHNKQGLNNTFIYHILEDNLDNLWLSTNGGLYRFNKKTSVFSNYTPKDGLQSTEFNLGAAFNDKKEGILYFGGINGYNYFKPSQVDKQNKESNLIFTGFTIKDKEVKPNPTNKILQKNITLTKEIKINYNDFPVNLSFTALDFRPNNNIKYVYKLVPEDKQWNSLKDKNSIQLLNLTPNSYTLQIQGTSRGKIWLKPPLELHLKVIPPWYKSTFAYILYLISFLSVVYFFYNIILQRRLADQESVRLKDLDNLKSRFITNITHEFRTPLTIILGFLDNLKEEYSDKKETKNSLDKIEKSSNDLLSLVNQMLDLAKLEQGNLHLHLIQNDIVIYLKYIVNSFESIANLKNINIRFKTNIEQLYMDFDAEKIRQIFTNLISNALKFSSENTTITIQIQRAKNNIEIHVLDEGYGIPNTDLTQIFDRFYQVNDNNFKISQGTGIGLSLTKELVELMSGSITVTSKLKQGTNFKVSLPIKNTARVKAIKQKQIKQLYRETVLEEENNYLKDTNCILIVEDNVEIANYIQRCLKQDYKIIKAKNGKQGLEIAMKQIPDLIISDIMMPIMDGFELTKKLQNNEVTNHIPIIILTSKTLQEDKLKGLSSGADAYLIKPFSKKELVLRIKKLIKKRAQLQEKYQVNSLPQQIKKEIIVTDKNLIFLNKVIAIIHGNIENSDFNAISLAKELAISDSQLYRKLKAISNTSPSVFIRKIRLEKAKELLQTTDLTIAEIAYTTGFNDPSWFSRVFKEEFKISPKEFRKQL